jgi:hypothetical protein
MANTDPEALEREIERTRAELARTIDAIADRVHPKQVARRTAARAEAKIKSFAASVVDTVSDAVGASPRPATLAEGSDDLWEDDRPNLAPVLIGVGAVLAVGAAIMLWRRRGR